MPARLLDGRALAAQLRDEVALRAQRLRERGIVPSLRVVIVGNDAAGLGYARALERAGAKAGVDVAVDALPPDADEGTVIARLRGLGEDPSIHGIILQQPLPTHLEIRRIAHALPAHKDVDGTNPLNLGRLASNDPAAFAPATPSAVMLLLEQSRHWPLRGVRCCVIGRSSVVGLPVALLLLARDATITIVHRKTRDVAVRTAEAEVIVAAAGVPNMLRAEMVAPGATVIDVGTNYIDDTLVGDVAFNEVLAVAGELTPVPGGVGPVTNIALLRNVLLAAQRAHPLDAD
jgi:methylenetetrahydrofolate dehydrogenase (NADP+)/methenyltetrahydrofolate cyclohydrolase